jgi:hypothetical protein
MYSFREKWNEDRKLTGNKMKWQKGFTSILSKVMKCKNPAVNRKDNLVKVAPWLKCIREKYIKNDTDARLLMPIEINKIALITQFSRMSPGFVAEILVAAARKKRRAIGTVPHRDDRQLILDTYKELKPAIFDSKTADNQHRKPPKKRARRVNVNIEDVEDNGDDDNEDKVENGNDVEDIPVVDDSTNDVVMEADDNISSLDDFMKSYAEQTNIEISPHMLKRARSAIANIVTEAVLSDDSD